MPKSLSEMQSSPDVGLPERTFPICVSGKLVAELEAADAELFEIEAELETERRKAQRRRDGEEPQLRRGAKSPVPDLERKAEAAAERSDEIRARMEEHTIPLHLKGKSNGEWRQWATKHPARDEDADPTGHQRDQRHAAGFCNVDALIAECGQFVAKYGDEAPAEGSWEFVASNATPGDLTRLASTVVAMHEQGLDLGKSRRAWRDARRSATDSE